MARNAVDESTTDDKGTSPVDKLLAAARERFKIAQEAEANQRKRETEDLEFQVPENQWDADAKADRGGSNGLPKRPMLSISRVDQPLQLVKNQMRNADLGVEVQPISEDADKDTAEAIQGHYRHIERKSRAEYARYWAFDRAAQAGRGSYRILTEYDDESEDPSDQRIVIKRIYHQEGVFFDPAAQEPDYSDARYAFVVTWMSRDEFKRRYPGKAPANDMEWSDYEGAAPGWFRPGKDVLVAEYWDRQITTEEKTDAAGKKHKRPVAKVQMTMLCGWDTLEETVDWPGKWIPLVVVIGRELQPFDGERRYYGMVRPARDVQKLSNVALSSAVERMLLEPKVPYVGPVEAFEGYEDHWKQANLRNFAYLPYNSYDKKGNQVQRPERAQIDQAGTNLALTMLQEADRLTQQATYVYDPSLGRENSRDKSGKAILALQQQADAGTSHFMQNMADAMQHEARIVLDLMPKIYDRPGRIARVIRGDDRKAEPVMFNAPFVVNQQGKPEMVEPGTEGAKEYNLGRGVYDVAVSIGKSFQSRLDEGSTVLGDLLAKKPDLFPLVGDIWMQFQSWPGSKAMADRLGKLFKMNNPGLSEGEDGAQAPEALQAKLQAMGMKMEQQGQQLQMAMQALQTEQAKQQAQIEKARLEATVQWQKAQLEADTKLRTVAAQEETKLSIAGLEAQIAQMLEALKLEREAREAERQAANDERDMAIEREKMDRAEVQSAADRIHQTQTGREQRADQARMGREQRQDQAGMAREQRQHDASMGREQMAHEQVMSEMNRPEPGEEKG